MMKVTKIFIGALPLVVLDLVAGCASPASPGATKPTVSHGASPTAQHYKYATNASLLAALASHGIKYGKVSQLAGGVTDLANGTEVEVFHNPADRWPGANEMSSMNGGTVLVGPNWAMATTPAFAWQVEQVVGQQVQVIGHAPLSPKELAKVRAARRAARQAAAAKKARQEAAAAAAKKARQQAAAAKKARQRAAAQAANTITYIVTGSSANVTYGPAGSDFTGSVPMNVSAPIGNNPAAYYALDAQLNGGGTVTVEILVGGKVISSATATGGYNIATAEIDQNPLTGQWENTNGG